MQLNIVYSHKGGYGSSGLSNGVLWTIFADCFYYMLVPIIYKIFRNSSSKVWLALILGGWVLNIFDNEIATAAALVPKIGGILANTVCVTGCLLYEFLIGSFLWFKRDILIKFAKEHKILVLLAWIAFTAFYYAYVYGKVFPVKEHPMHSPCLGILVPWLTIATGYALKEARLGDFEISYGIFLNHMIVVEVLMFFGIFSPIGIVITVVLTPMLAAVSKWAVEKPSLKLKIR